MKTIKQTTKTKPVKSKTVAPVVTSLKDSLRHIVKHGKTNRFAQNLYRDGDNYCPLGLFFSSEQLDYIASMTNDDGQSMNGDNILSLALVLGDQNIEAVTGMTPLQAYMIQHLNDIEGPLVMLAFVDEILSGKRKAIGDVDFKIGKERVTK